MFRRIYIHAAISTLLAFLVLLFSSSIINLNTSNFNGFNSISAKLNFTDYYYSNFYSNNKINKDVVLINIGDIDRATITKLLDKVHSLNPSVIGLDVIFQNRGDSIIDQNLIQTIENCQSIVLPIVPKESISKEIKKPKGSINLESDANGVVKYVQLEGSEHFPSFSQVIAREYSEKSLSNTFKFLEHSVLKEINYFGDHNNFTHYEWSEILDTTPSIDFSNKIVLIGYAGSNWDHKACAEDHYFTPLDVSNNRLNHPSVSGMVIHANAITNFINNNFIKNVPPLLNTLLLAFVAFLINLYYMRYYRASNIPFYLRCRLFQILLTSLVAYLSFLLFDQFRIKTNLSQWIATLAISYDVCMFYILILLYLGNKYNFRSYIYLKAIK